MMTPTLGESVTEATVARWTKKAGDPVRKDEVLVELETDKVSLEVVAPEDGVLTDIAAAEGETVEPGALLGRVTAGADAKAAPAAPKPETAAAPPPTEEAKAAPARKAPSPPAQAKTPSAISEATPAPAEPARTAAQPILAPSAARIVEENALDAGAIAGTGKAGRITKGDALAALEARASAPQADKAVQVAVAPREAGPREERVRMTRLRQTIARRLKEAQNAAAMLTTFNEVDMSAVMGLRNQYKDVFEQRHGVRLGFMSFFVKAAIAALKAVPDVNAEIDGTDIIYKNHYDIGVAVGTDRGLVVPVVRDADALDLAGIERTIAELGRKARDGTLSLDELQGGTFTISNGGVYGSLMSTPILNAPQSGILGMHKIQDRPMAVGGQVVIRPMMYLALSYDHRVVDGQGAVTFLVRIKEHIEEPSRLLLGL
ncbi:MAG TPA: 2-oxoglutarate dehydrogenase complex dihydrolipoyllysine-residue succinyltransferase [Caulobacteraceae bacterium]|nr:2-oxoglutarate dehydrogenase complex dihydrolipoyllysine-residue succinyltransferase [Caulobacteraceae bacterium]